MPCGLWKWVHLGFGTNALVDALVRHYMYIGKDTTQTKIYTKVIQHKQYNSK